MRIINFPIYCVLFVLCGILSGCATRTSPSDLDSAHDSNLPEYSYDQTTTNAQANFKWQAQLYNKADLVLEYHSEDFVERYKPSAPGNKHVSTAGTNAFAEAIPSPNECGRSLAVVVLPSEWPLCANCKTIEEVASDVRDSLIAHGFQRVRVVTTRWAQWFELFPKGWPSREERRDS
jgi:hypothetical protein